MPDYTGLGFDALNDSLSEIDVPEDTGLMVALDNFSEAFWRAARRPVALQRPSQRPAAPRRRNCGRRAGEAERSSATVWSS